MNARIESMPPAAAKPVALAAAPAKANKNQDSRDPMRFGLWALALGFGGFIIWAALAPLDEGVPVGATVVIDTKRKPVQHLTGGILKEVLVGEGENVKAGQTVARLFDAVTRANYESVRQQYRGLRATEARILAEQTDVTTVEFPPEVMEDSDPMVMQQVETQRQLFQSRRQSLEAELTGIRATIAGQQAMIAGYKGQLVSYEQQLALLQQELDGIRGLVAEGYAPRTRQLELERNAAGLQGQILEVRGNITRTERDIAELNARGMQRRQEYRKDGDERLASIRLELQADKERLNAAEGELARVELKAPVDGQVVGLEVQSVGAVIQPAQKIMDIVPSDEPLLLEAQVPPQFVDRVRPGQTVTVRFSAFAHSPALSVDGTLDSISHDLVEEQTAGGEIKYYLARIGLTPEGVKKLGERQMQPGMPAEAVIKTGERTLLTYLLHPLTKRLARAMKEE